MTDSTSRFYYKGERLKPLRAFCQVARLGSVSRAAEALFLSQPAVSLQLQALERDFGTRLFERTGRRFGLTIWQRALPMQLCDWAMFVIIIALCTGNRRWLEIAYFWGIGGTLQAIITPNLAFGFPDLRFISFFVAHSGIIIGIVFLMLIYGFRPRAAGILRTFLWTEVYFVVAFTVDSLTGENYGFLLHKPEAFSLLSYLSDWRPLYLLQMHGLALLFFCALYAPFALVDLARGKYGIVKTGKQEAEG